jgi:hypothetical protein
MQTRRGWTDVAPPDSHNPVRISRRETWARKTVGSIPMHLQSVGRAGGKQARRAAVLNGFFSLLRRRHCVRTYTACSNRGNSGKRGQQTNAGTEQQHPGTCISRQALACQTRTGLNGALLGRIESFARPLKDWANASRILYRVFYKETRDLVLPRNPWKHAHCSGHWPPIGSTHTPKLGTLGFLLPIF